MEAKHSGTRVLLYVLLPVLCLSLPACIVGDRTSGRPIYPDNWPALEVKDKCPDISGRYRAISDEAAPLVYERGDNPSAALWLLVAIPLPFGRPDVPALGRRVLPWHLAGVFGSDKEDWDALTAYETAVGAALLRTGLDDEAGWVEVRESTDGGITVQAGLHDQAMVSFALRKERQGLWDYKSHVYTCSNQGLAVAGIYPAPPVENPLGHEPSTNAEFTFYRASDGSLVGIESDSGGVAGGTTLFQKWWRWRRINQ